MTIKEVSEKYGISSDTLRYYERVGVLPPITRTSGGIRDFGEEDLAWIELVLCMRSAGLPIEAIIEYVMLFQFGDSTFSARLELLSEQRRKLLEQREKIDITIDRLNYKIAKYEKAVKTGQLDWEKGSCK